MEEKYGTQYQYSLLENAGSFRLLKIFPGAPSQSIICRLLHYSLHDEHPPYDALSYTWGDPTLSWENMIFVDGRPFLVTANLHSALSLMRDDRSKPILIWADAICINQADLDERSQQVLLMCKIYQQSERAVVHMGNTWYGCDDLMPFLLDLEDATIRAFASRVREGPLTTQESRLFGFPDAFAGSKPLSAFFRRDWFNRIWVLQEAVVAKRVVFKSLSWEIEWTDLLPVMNAANALGLRLSSPDEGGMAMFNNFAQFSCMANLGAGEHDFEKRKLIEILQGARRNRATDPRDHVYGALGLAIEGDEPALRPRYTDSVEQVYIRTAQFLAENGDGICLLYSAFMEKDPKYVLPSWIPNWASAEVPLLRVAPYGSILAKEHRGTTCFSASGETEAHVKVKNESNQLAVRGLVAGRLTHMGVKCAQQDPLPAMSNQTLDWTNQVLGDFRLVQCCLDEVGTLNESNERYTREELNDIVWRLLICNSVGKTVSPAEIAGDEQHRNFEAYRRAQRFQHGADQARHEWAKQYTGNLNDDVASGSLYTNVAQVYCRGMRRASTEQGHLAQVPPLAEIGDSVFIPFGSAIPIVIRRKRDGEFVVVGECYVHGLMNGEALDVEGSVQQEVTFV